VGDDAMRRAAVPVIVALLCLPACTNESKDTVSAGNGAFRQAETAKLHQPSGSTTAAAAGQRRPNEASQADSPRAGAARPTIKFARILPAAPNKDSVIEIEAEAGGGESVTLTYEWYVNGRAAGREQTIESPSRLKGGLSKGDRVEVHIVPSVGGTYGEPVARSVVIGNTPPVIEPSPVDVKFDSGVQTFRIAATDPDGDAISFGLTDAPDGMSMESATGIVRWKLPESAGDVSFTVVASDPDGGQSVLNVNAGVKPAVRKKTGK